jgi:hypothetical protein
VVTLPRRPSPPLLNPFTTIPTPQDFKELVDDDLEPFTGLQLIAVVLRAPASCRTLSSNLSISRSSSYIYNEEEAWATEGQRE